MSNVNNNNARNPNLPGLLILIFIIGLLLALSIPKLMSASHASNPTAPPSVNVLATFPPARLSALAASSPGLVYSAASAVVVTPASWASFLR